jgi:hypothetical protein
MAVLLARTWPGRCGGGLLNAEISHSAGYRPASPGASCAQVQRGLVGAGLLRLAGPKPNPRFSAVHELNSTIFQCPPECLYRGWPRLVCPSLEAADRRLRDAACDGKVCLRDAEERASGGDMFAYDYHFC